jgi:DNA repair protein SbcC/Rad50
MRIETVKATAFGPFSGEVLELAPGMNVIYGPNESGKSSWHAALYAGMCGMRKTRGQPTREDRAFASRHRPWRGTTWQVSTVLALDDKRTIEIEQGLTPGARSTARDRRSKRPLSDEIVRAGAVDAATLLGLTRETALATVFVRQADMLRVLSDAGALQEYLERAAATSTADTTADEAIARILAYRKERVGLLRAGSRGPLATAVRRLKEARDALDKAEERFESYQELLAQRHTAEGDVREVEQHLKEVVDHERERQRREQWEAIRAAQRRLEQARRLTGEAAAIETSVVDKDLVSAVTRALVAFESRPAKPLELDGPTSLELEEQLASIPDMPDGDLEPGREVVQLLDRWHGEQQRLAAHDENEPQAIGASSLPTAPSELRRLADELELPVPEVDPALVRDVEQRRSLATRQEALRASAQQPAVLEPTTAPRSPLPLVFGAVLVVGGGGLLAVGQVVVGLVLLLVGASVAATGARVRSPRARPATPSAPRTNQMATGSPLLRAPDHELPRLEARLALQQETQAQAERRIDAAFARLDDLALPADPNELRRLAAEGDATTTAEARYTEWRRRQLALQSRVSLAADELRSALSMRGVRTAKYRDLEKAVARYTDECHERAALARQAERRRDIETQLMSRRAAESSRQRELAARLAAEEQLRAVAKATGCHARSVDALPDVLREWLSIQEKDDQDRQRREKSAARLDQILEGLTLEEFEADIADLIADAGEPPPDDARQLQDRSAELNEVQARAQRSRATLSELVGQIEGAERHLLDVSVAIEAEARAAAEVARLTALADDLDVASEILGAAQQKVHADIAPLLNETIRPWVSRITRGRYDDIRVNPATLEVEAHEAGGQFRPATVLSHGTTEQLFLLLRLALAQRLTTTGERAPIVLDDVTVQSDADRTVAVLDLLHELSGQHQVVLFSQEEEVLRWAERELDASTDRLIRLNASL